MTTIIIVIIDMHSAHKLLWALFLISLAYMQLIVNYFWVIPKKTRNCYQ